MYMATPHLHVPVTPATPTHVLPACLSSQEKLRKAQAAPRLTPGAGKLKEYTERLAKAEAEADTLKAALARAHQQQQAGGEAASTSGRRPTPGQASAGGAAAAGASTSGGVGGDDVSREADLFELKLQRDQAQLQARRLAERLRDLFGPEASDLSLPLPPGSTSSGPLPGSARSTGGATTSGRQALGGAKGVVSAREAELQSTISSLRSALEKTTATSTPTTKYMAVSGAGCCGTCVVICAACVMVHWRRVQC
jgi:hypothetical protein